VNYNYKAGCRQLFYAGYSCRAERITAKAKREKNKAEYSFKKLNFIF
jgi:hypothetical protein